VPRSCQLRYPMSSDAQGNTVANRKGISQSPSDDCSKGLSRSLHRGFCVGVYLSARANASRLLRECRDKFSLPLGSTPSSTVWVFIRTRVVPGYAGSQRKIPSGLWSMRTFERVGHLKPWFPVRTAQLSRKRVRSFSDPHREPPLHHVPVQWGRSLSVGCFSMPDAGAGGTAGSESGGCAPRAFQSLKLLAPR